jgi:hypothetical protein
VIKNLEKYQNHLTGSAMVTFGDGHVGGCNIFGDPSTELPKTWKYLADKYNIKSVIDIGAGFGYHSKYFKDILNCDILSIEGSDKVVELSLVPEDVVWHDYTTGPYIPNKIYDFCWTIEFVEHVEEKYKQNFIETFKKCRYLAMTHGVPGQGGYHHVNCQPMEYWVSVLSDNGFVLLEEETHYCRNLSLEDSNDYYIWRDDPNPNKPYRGPAAQASEHRKSDIYAPYFSMNGLVFKNLNI